MDDLLTAATLTCSLAICVRLLIYRAPAGSRHRRGIAFVAWLLIASTGGQAVQILLQDAHATPSAWHLVLLAVLLIAICRARGNLARLFGVD
jgi:hypothetical protein